MTLTQFTNPTILETIGHSRIAKFLDTFFDDLARAKIRVPSPESQNGNYFHSIAEILADPIRLPQSLQLDLLTLERAALPANQQHLNDIIQRRLPSVALTNCPLDRALEVWFAAPEELARFSPSPAEIQNYKTQIEIANDEAAFRRLARLTPAQYDRVRKAEAAKLGIRAEVLDSEVERCKCDLAVQAALETLHNLEPWPEPVDGAEVLTQISSRFTLHIVLPLGAPDALTLWDAHAHCFKAFVQTPRLNLTSPEGECGKSTTLALLATMTPRALCTDNLTAPVLFRIVEQYQPTLLLDELDTYLTQERELRGLLNAGHKRGACALRCEGEKNSVPAFKAFPPAAFAGIGSLPATLNTRSIHIHLVKALPGEIFTPFDENNVEIETTLGRKLARWAQDNFAALQACKPIMPPGAHNRLADNWRPLFAIAQVAGGDWPRRALEAFNHLTARKDPNAQSFGIRLLSDIRKIFTESGSDRLTSKQLVDSLCDLPDGIWLEANKGGKPISETWLGRQLSRFEINPQPFRLGDTVSRGYQLADFTDAFTRFLNHAP